MGSRKRDEVIYIRTDKKGVDAFQKQREKTGMQNAEFLNYLLLSIQDKTIDGAALAEIAELLKQISLEHKRQGNNLNQVARILNTWGGMDVNSSFQFTNMFYKKIEDLLLKIWEKVNK